MVKDSKKVYDKDLPERHDSVSVRHRPHRTNLNPSEDEKATSNTCFEFLTETIGGFVRRCKRR